MEYDSNLIYKLSFLNSGLSAYYYLVILGFLTLLVILFILTTNLAAVVCVDVCQCEKFDQFLPARSHFESKRSENFVRIAKFPYAAFGPLFAFHCPLFFYEKQ